MAMSNWKTGNADRGGGERYSGQDCVNCERDRETNLQAGRGDEALDLRGLGRLLAVLLNLAANDKLADVISLGEAEQLSDAGGTLRAEAAGLLVVGQTLNVLLALLDDDEVNNGHLGRDDAAAHGLALALARLARAVARHA